MKSQDILLKTLKTFYTMAWDCKLKSNVKLNLSYVITLLMITTIVPNVSSLYFDCDSVNINKPAKQCTCVRLDESGYEIDCRERDEQTAPVTYKVFEYNSKQNEAALRVQCVDHNPKEFPWSVVELDFGKSNVHFKITKLEVNYCPAALITDGWKGFFKHVNMSGEAIRHFSFVSHMNVESLPINFLSVMTNLEELNVRNNQLTTMPNVHGLTKLKSLNIRGNSLVIIPSNVFSTNENLEVVAFAGNLITSLEPQIFPTSLLHLDMANNKLSRLTKETFSTNKNLQRLLLNLNPLQNLEPDTFNGMSELVELYLDSSQFVQVPSLENMDKLRNLTISNWLPANTKGKREIIFRNLPSLETLRLYNCQLETIPTLENLPLLSILSLARNNITSVPNDSFINLSSLLHLDLSRNAIEELGQIRASDLIDLNLSQNNIKTLTKSSFQYLFKLKSLNLRKNKIENVDTKSFETLAELEEIDLSYNHINFSSNADFPHLSANNGGFDGFSTDQSPLKYCYKLQRLDLGHNLIDKIYDDWKNILLYLTSVNLSYNNITQLEAIDIVFISGDMILDLSFNQITKLDWLGAKIFLDLDSDREMTTQVLLDGNPLYCDCNAYYYRTFSSKLFKFKDENLLCNGPENLFNKPLVKVPLKELRCKLDINDGCPEDCLNCWDQPADKTIQIDCSKRNLKQYIVPNVSKFGKEYGHYEFQLDLSDNDILILNETFGQHISPRVKLVDLTSNGLTSLRFLSSFGQNNNTKFSLAHNPLKCDDCSEFQPYLQLYASRFEDINKMTCIEGSTLDNLINDHPKLQFVMNQTQDSYLCSSSTLSAEIRALIIVIGLLLGMLIVLVGIYLRYGWALRAFLYAKGLDCCLCDNNLDDDQEKIFDAFISYSHKDEEWVLSQLVTQLEKEGFKLCLHFRDWIPGEMIPNNIIRSVDSSRRTIVVLSKNFLQSVWSRLEFQTGHRQALAENSSRLILILLEDDFTPADVQDEDLRVYMKLNTYLKWNDQWFWHKLRYALPHKKSLEQDHTKLKREQRERAIQLDKLRAKLEQNV